MRNLKIDHNQRVQDLLELVQLEGLGDRCVGAHQPLRTSYLEGLIIQSACKSLQ
jgi:hypothetical protein